MMMFEKGFDKACVVSKTWNNLVVTWKIRPTISIGTWYPRKSFSRCDLFQVTVVQLNHVNLDPKRENTKRIKNVVRWRNHELGGRGGRAKGVATYIAREHEGGLNMEGEGGDYTTLHSTLHSNTRRQLLWCYMLVCSGRPRIQEAEDSSQSCHGGWLLCRYLATS